MNYLKGLALGTVGGIVLRYVIKWLPGWLAGEEKKALAYAHEKLSPADETLLLNIIKWADDHIPGSNQGHEKYLAAANLITARFPMIPADKLDALIESAVDKLKAGASDTP